MKTIKYNGPYEEVEVPALGATIAKGESVEVSDAQAKSLLNSENWSEVANSKNAKEATK